MAEHKGWRLLEWLGRIETIHALVTSEFIRTLLLPTVVTVIGAGVGVLQGVPLMWIIVGSSLIFMAITQSLLRTDEYKERRNPQNKLKVVVIFQMDLVPAAVPFMGNRKQRLAQKATGQEPRVLQTDINPYVNRIMSIGQLGVQLTNTATFPISCYLESAKTDIEGIMPPRSDFPKPPCVIPTGGKVRVVDDRIELDDMPCHTLSGNLDMLIKYGLPGKEHFELRVNGPVEVHMTTWGLVSSITLSLDASRGIN